MGLTSLPTRVSGSLGATKVDLNVFTYSTGVLPSGEWNNAAQAIFEVCEEVGLADGSTTGSLKAIVNSLQSSSYIVVSATSSLANERVMQAGPGIAMNDYGAGSIFAVSCSIVTHQYIGMYDSSTVTSSAPKTVGSAYFVPSESTKTTYSLRTILATSTGSDVGFVQLYNVTSGAYVHIGGAGITVLSTSNTTPTFLQSVNLYGATNFNSSIASIYELQYYGSGSVHLTFHYGSEIVGT